MRKLIFIVFLFISTSVFAQEKCGELLEGLGLCKNTELIIPDILNNEPEPNKRIFANCIIARVKANMNTAAVGDIRRACREKAKDPSIIDWIRYGW